MSDEDFLIILKRIRILLSRNAWLEAKEYTQIEIDNLEKSNHKTILDRIKKCRKM